jgi:hypothetical protein
MFNRRDFLKPAAGALLPDAKPPNVDRLARQGAQFTQFYVNGSVCSPSRTAFMTGHFPARHRVLGHFADAALNEARGMPNWLFRARSTDLIVDETLRFIEQNRHKPFYVNVWSLLPHAALPHFRRPAQPQPGRALQHPPRSLRTPPPGHRPWPRPR